MGEENGNGDNGYFKGFVKSEIGNIKDAAKRNNEDHEILFDGIKTLGETVVRVETKLDMTLENRKKRRSDRGKIWAALITAGLGLIGTAIIAAVTILGG